VPELRAVSIAEKDGAFRAAGSEDVGSPGLTTGPVPVSIYEPPTSQTVDGCGSAQLQVLAEGYPRPGYQWFSGGEPIPGATGSRLVFPEVATIEGGEFFVIVSNGLSAETSSVARLTINTNPLPPRILTPPQDSTVFPGQNCVLFCRDPRIPVLELSMATEWRGSA
jgi:hypothetical protein